jgi:hypothetical protein
MYCCIHSSGSCSVLTWTSICLCAAMVLFPAGSPIASSLTGASKQLLTYGYVLLRLPCALSSCRTTW